MAVPTFRFVPRRSLGEGDGSLLRLAVAFLVMQLRGRRELELMQAHVRIGRVGMGSNISSSSIGSIISSSSRTAAATAPVVP